MPRLTLVATLALVACTKGPTAHHEHDAPAAAKPAAVTPAPEAAPAGNVVQAEMRLLHEATRDWVTAVANNQLGDIPPAISRVHTARVATEKALERGEYALPKGGDLAAFAKQDEAFHDELVKLLRASKADDLPAATKQLGVVLEGCTSCHQQYRF